MRAPGTIRLAARAAHMPDVDEQIDGPTADPDTAAVSRALVDPAAFAVLYDRYVGAVYGYCRHRLGDPDEAEDAASLVFARAIAALPRYHADGPGTFRSWLFAIAHNTVANHHRARRLDRPLDEAAALAMPDPSPSPEDLAVSADRHRALRAGLDRLPDDQRRVVELRLAGLTGPEIAAALGRSHGAVKMLQLRAIDRLRVLLGPLETDSRPGGKEDADAAR